MPTLQTKPETRIADNDKDWRNWDWSAHNNCDHIPNAETRRNWEDVDAGRNIIGPFATAAEAVRAMLEGADDLDDA